MTALSATTDKTPLRLLFVIHHLRCGGAERVLILLANALHSRGHSLTVATLAGPHEPFAPLTPGIELVHLDAASPSSSPLQAARENFRRVGLLRVLFRAQSPDAVLAFMDTTNILCTLAAKGLGIPVVAAEHIDPSAYSIGRVWGALRRAVYPWAAAVVTLTSSAARYFSGWNGLRLEVIPNPVVLTDAPPIEVEHGQKTIFAMGRLHPQKGFDFLLHACSIIFPARPQWKLVILGDGPERAALEEQVDRLGLSGRVSMPGYVDDPCRVMAEGAFFTLSSRFEGFPMALCEAMATGLPIVAFDCPSGPADIVRPGIDGLLVPPRQVEALAEAMAQMMDNEDMRARMGEQARTVADRFSVDSIAKRWEALFREVRSGRGSDG